MEATSIAQAKGRLEGTRFAVLVFTNLTQDHLDFHGSMEAYFDAKRALFRQAERAVVNVGDEYGRRLAAERPDAVVFDDASAADLLDGIDLKLRGGFNRENAVAAALSARALGVDDDAIRRGIETRRGRPGPVRVDRRGAAVPVIVDYAHTPDSLENVLRAARELATGRLIVVFGAGGDRDREKRPLMGRVASSLADRAIVTSDNPRSEDPAAIADEVAAGAVADVEIELDRRAAIERALEDAAGRRRRRDRRQGRRRRAGAARRARSLRRPRGRARGAAAAGGARVIPLELSLVEPLGRLHARPWADAVTGVQIDSRRIAEGDLFVAVGGGVDFVAPRARARRRRGARPGRRARRARDDRRRRPRPLERARRRDHRRRPARRRRRTSSRLSARRSGGRSRPRATTTTSSACRSRCAGSSRTRRSASPRWGCAASARSRGSRRSRGRTWA